jgi:hypothetical protein
LSSFTHAFRVSLISFLTAVMTCCFAFVLFPTPPIAFRRKYFMIDRRAYVPHVNGGRVSRSPSRFASASPLQGTWNVRVSAPSGDRDHTTFSTESGPGDKTARPIGPWKP